MSVVLAADTDAAFAGLPHVVLPATSKLATSLIGEHTIAVENPGSFGLPASALGETLALDPAKLLDIVVYVELVLT